MVDREEVKKEEIEKDRILQVRSDTLFHDLFNENDMITLEWVVSKILDCDYEKIKGRVKIHDTRLTRVNKYEKKKYVDLIVEYETEKIIIELNNNFQGLYTRNILYATNVLLNNYKLEKEDYDYYKKIVRVLLVNLNWYSKNKGMKVEGKKIYEIPYTDLERGGYLLKIINVNLDYYKNLCYDKVKDLDKFYKLLTIDNKEDLEEMTKEEGLLKNYSNKIKNLSNNEKYVEVIMDEIIEENVAKQTAYLLGEQSGFDKGMSEGIHQGREKGFSEGIDKGFSEGINQEKKSVVINMYNKKYKLEDIVEITNLTIEEIEKIINN